VPADAAALLLDFTVWRVPRLASPAEARGWASVYGFELEGPGGGPLTLEVRADGATATRAAAAGADITLTIPVEAWIRLLWGRLDLAAALAAGTVRARGEREPILALVPLFPGH
jgi:putative sterol carrier protein